jgi:phosphoenolpyruvate-protein phosphotransferase
VITLEGIALSPGVAIGPVATVRGTPVAAPRGDDGRMPRERFADARRAARAELRRGIDALPDVDGAAGQILRAHLALVDDPAIVAEVERRIDCDGMDASAALEGASASLAKRFEALGDPVLRGRAADIRDVCECIAHHIAGSAPEMSVPRGAERGDGAPCIVCAAALSPAQVVQLAGRRVLAFVVEQAAETSHTAILIRALAVPAVIGARGATGLVHDGDLVLVDGNRGRVIIRPEPDAFPTVQRTASTTVQCDASPARTCDGTPVAVTASIGGAADARLAMEAGADGIGLFRTELLFLQASRLPSENEQYVAYREVAALVGSKPLTVRTLDLGGDKRPAALGLPTEPNPALGLRGLRLSLAYPDLLTTQIRALLRASPGRRMRLLVPMVAEPADVVRVRDILADVARGLDAAAAVVRPEIGVMVETPAAALMADELADVADFLSIGTNDLTQYVLAVDRDNTAVAPLYQTLHPAVLRLMRGIAAAAVRRRKPVAVCGEAAADRLAIPLLVGLGVSELSVRPAAVHEVKEYVRRTSTDAARALFDEVSALATAAAVLARLREALAPEADADVHEARDAR